MRHFVEALAAVQSRRVALVLADVHSHPLDGFELLGEIHQADSGVRRLLLVGWGGAS